MQVIALIYVGITLLLMPYFLYLPERSGEISKIIGIISTITGIIWFFTNRLERIFCKSMELFSGLLSHDIREVKLIESRELYKEIKGHFFYGDISIIINNDMIGNWIDDLIDYISSKNKNEKINILLTGIVNEKSSNTVVSETDIFLQRIKKSYEKGENIELRLVEQHSANTILIGRNGFSLIVPFGQRCKEMFYIYSYGHTEYFREHKERFKELWGKSIVHK